MSSSTNNMDNVNDMPALLGGSRLDDSEVDDLNSNITK